MSKIVLRFIFCIGLIGAEAFGASEELAVRISEQTPDRQSVRPIELGLGLQSRFADEINDGVREGRFLGLFMGQYRFHSWAGGAELSYWTQNSSSGALHVKSRTYEFLPTAKYYWRLLENLHLLTGAAWGGFKRTLVTEIQGARTELSSAWKLMGGVLLGASVPMIDPDRFLAEVDFRALRYEDEPEWVYSANIRLAFKFGY